MSSNDRRSAGRRRAWGRGPIILKFEPLEGRELLSTSAMALPNLVASSFVTTTNADWGEPITASGVIKNQGRGSVTSDFNVAIYASHNSRIGPMSVLIGKVTIPAGLDPGESVPFTTTVNLPSSPVAGMSSNVNGTVHINLKIDPDRIVPESNYRNQSGLGPGYDQSAVQITPTQPANVVARSIGILAPNPVWGGTLVVTAQISNQGYGDASPTTARVVLTPSGVAQGGASDVTIGTIDVPAISAWSQVNVEKTITLPETTPVLLAGQSAFTLSVIPDVNYVTNAVYPNFAVGGIGVDQSPVGIVVANGTTLPVLGNLPDLAVGTVTTSSSDLHWGKPVQVTAEIENLGAADPGSFDVDYILVGASGDVTHGIYLGKSTMTGLAAGTKQTISEILELPLRLPAGIALSTNGSGRIAAIVNPGHSFNESFINNNEATSRPVSIRLLGSDGSTTVPTTPYADQLLPVKKPIVSTKATKPVVVRTASGTKRLYRRPPAKTNSIIHELTVFPKQVKSFIKNLI